MHNADAEAEQRLGDPNEGDVGDEGRAGEDDYLLTGTRPPNPPAASSSAYICSIRRPSSAILVLPLHVSRQRGQILDLLQASSAVPHRKTLMTSPPVNLQPQNGRCAGGVLGPGTWRRAPAVGSWRRRRRRVGRPARDALHRRHGACCGSGGAVCQASSCRRSSTCTSRVGWTTNYRVTAFCLSFRASDAYRRSTAVMTAVAGTNIV